MLKNLAYLISTAFVVFTAMRFPVSETHPAEVVFTLWTLLKCFKMQNVGVHKNTFVTSWHKKCGWQQTDGLFPFVLVGFYSVPVQQRSYSGEDTFLSLKSMQNKQAYHTYVMNINCWHLEVLGNLSCHLWHANAVLDLPWTDRLGLHKSTSNPKNHTGKWRSDFTLFYMHMFYLNCTVFYT